MATDHRVFVFVHPAYADMICYPQTWNVWDAFKRHGAVVRFGDDVLQVDPAPDDRFVCYGRIDERKSVLRKFSPQHVWSYVVDEATSTSAPYEKALAYMSMYAIRNVIVTYQNAQHLAKLAGLGIRHIVMPHTMPGIRPEVPKVHGVLLSGQRSSSFYPTRTRTMDTLKHLKEHVFELETPGQDISTRRHDVIRDSYYSLLDTCRMGVVCRAGHRDRFVAKYVEMGACNCLPIGDCPSYMPTAMKEAMVNVEGMDAQQVADEVKRLLERDTVELQQRTAAYVSEVRDRYLVDPNMQRVMQELTDDGGGCTHVIPRTFIACGEGGNYCSEACMHRASAVGTKDQGT
jgi:hypothetical protein